MRLCKPVIATYKRDIETFRVVLGPKSTNYIAWIYCCSDSFRQTITPSPFPVTVLWTIIGEAYKEIGDVSEPIRVEF